MLIQPSQYDQQCGQQGNAEKLVGRLVAVHMYGDWGRGLVQTEDLRSVKVAGKALNGLETGKQFEFLGSIVHHPTYGARFDITGVSAYIPLDPKSLVKHLRRSFKGVGEVTAKKLVALHVSSGTLEQLRDQLVRDPYAIDFSVVTKRIVTAEVDVGIPEMIFRDLSTRFGAIVNAGVLKALSVWLAENSAEIESPIDVAWRKFAANPYEPIHVVHGYGFASADAIGRHLQVPFDFPQRLAALATFALDQGCIQSGHTFLTYAQLQKTLDLIDYRVSVESAVKEAVLAGEPIEQEGDRYYPAAILEAERRLANLLVNREHNPVPPIYAGDIDLLAPRIEAAMAKLGVKKDPSQLAALEGILLSPQSVHTITAGPGCGKTKLIEVLVEVIGDARSFKFCTPTGKSAKVLTARIMKWGLRALTIHSMLQVTDDGFRFNSGNLLPVDVVIADETSMDDLQLLTALMAAIPPHAHIILLGDNKQLQSVGPGDCLADLLKLPFDHHRLTKTHRNDGGILEVVTMAGNGKVDHQNREDVTFSGHLPEASEEGINSVLREYVRSVRACGNDYSKVGLLVARRKGEANTPGWNVTYLNARLKRALNPHGEKIVGTQFSVGDRIIVRKNLMVEAHEKNEGDEIPVEIVVNGDTGYIRGFHMRADGPTELECLILQLDDGRMLKYPASGIISLGLGWAITVHAAQGSEYERVLFICINGSPTFIHCGILFTAFSRAKSHLHVIGDPDVIGQVARRPIPPRNSSLVGRFFALHDAR